MEWFTPQPQAQAHTTRLFMVMIFWSYIYNILSREPKVLRSSPFRSMRIASLSLPLPSWKSKAPH